MTYWNVFPEYVQWGWNNIQLFQGMLAGGGYGRDHLVGRSHWYCYMMYAIWMLGFARNIVFLSSKRRFRCRKSWHAHAAVYGRRRFSVESCSNYACSGTEGSKAMWALISILALMIFLLNVLLKSASKSSFFRLGVEIRFWSCNLRMLCVVP